VSLTFLFTDLKGSTELYARVGDLVAYELVRKHFHLLNAIVAAEGGAVVKTIGDAVMATFSTPDRAVAAALRMREAIGDVGNDIRQEDLLLKLRSASTRGHASRSCSTTGWTTSARP
jgi:class 3 adenylate cyclase